MAVKLKSNVWQPVPTESTVQRLKIKRERWNAKKEIKDEQKKLSIYLAMAYPKQESVNYNLG